MMRKANVNTEDFTKKREISVDGLKGRYGSRLVANGLLLARTRPYPPSGYVSKAPSRYLEYSFYAAVFYAYMGDVLGLSFNMLGASIHAVLAVLCLVRLRAQAVAVLGLPVLFAVSFTFIQIAVHGESLMDPPVRPIVVWLLEVIIVSTLVSRPGFIPRFAAAQFLIGLTVLPFLDLSYAGTERAGLSEHASVLTNPNGLAAFFGFIAIAFTVRGMESRRRLTSWLSMAIALFSLFILALTVSRGPLLAYALGLVIALRKQLRRGFIPVLILVALGGGAFASGLLDRVIGSYSERATEDTGRSYLWSVASARFIESPIAGVGASRTPIEMPGGKEAPPHNAFLTIGCSSGIVPLLLFAGYWLVGLRGALRASPENPVCPYLLPLWVYAFFWDQFTSEAYFQPWSIFCVCICLVQLIRSHADRQPRRKLGVMLNLQRGRMPAVARPLWTRK
jgi:hypothetical protein